MHYFCICPVAFCVYSKDKKIYYNNTLLVYIRYCNSIPHKFGLKQVSEAVSHIRHPDPRSLNLKYVTWSKQKHIPLFHLAIPCILILCNPLLEANYHPVERKEIFQGDLRCTSGGGVREGRREGDGKRRNRALSLV